MSPRAQTQNEILDFLNRHENYFNAPYGILSGTVAFGKGKARQITFGVSRYLDASITILAPNKIKVRGQGGLTYKFEGEFSSSQELIKHFEQELPK